MPTTDTSTAAVIAWEPLTNSSRVVFVGRIDEKPVAIIEMLPGTGFRATTCGGARLGDFVSLAGAITACADHLDLSAV